MFIFTNAKRKSLPPSLQSYSNNSNNNTNKPLVTYSSFYKLGIPTDVIAGI